MLGENNQYGSSTFRQSFKGFSEQNPPQLLKPNNPTNQFPPFSQTKSFFNTGTQNHDLFGQLTNSQGTLLEYNPIVKKGGLLSPFAEKLNCITCMDVYKNKSLEELRWEDYQHNLKELTQTTPLRSFTNRASFFDKPVFCPSLKNPNENFLTDLQPQTPCFLPTTKLTPDFNSPSPTPQSSFLRKINSTSFKATPVQLIDQIATQPQQTVNVFSDFSNPTLTVPTNAITTPGDEFYNHVQNIFQPFPRREFLANVGSNFDMNNRTTDPNVINDILNKLRTSDNYKSKSSSTTPSSEFSQIKKSFFEDVEKQASASNSNRSLVLNKQLKENLSRSFEKNSGSFPNKISQNLQITVVKTININYNTFVKSVDLPCGLNSQIGKDSDPSEINSNCGGNCRIEIKQSEASVEESLKNIKSHFQKSNNKIKKCLNFSEENNLHSVGTIVDSLNLDNNSCKITQTKTSCFKEKAVQCTSEKHSVGDCRNANSCNVKLTKAGYYTEPAFEELYKYQNDSVCVLKGFLIGRKGYGKVRFLDSVNIFDLDLDKIIDIDYRYVTVYPDDEKKPQIGEGLNVKAEITIDQIWPLDKASDTIITDIEKIKKMNFIDKLKIMAEKQNASFVDYIPDTGSWVFNVEHF